MNQPDVVRSNGLFTASLATVIVAVSCCSSVLGEERNGMLLIPTRKAVVGSNAAQREELAKRFDCHPTWLGDDLTRHEVQLPAFWIDRYPVTNAQYLSDTRPHHGVQFQLMKGASWFHEDPLSYRSASGWYAYEGWRSAFTGFRCALDGKQEPPPARKSQSAKAVSSEAAREQLAAVHTRGPITVNAAGGTSRHLSIRIPRFGPEVLSLSAPETIVWNGNGVMTWRKTPDMTWTVQTPERAAYEMRFEQVRVEAEFLAGDDCVQQRFTAVNLTQRPGSFHTSSCFNLQGHPMFYDCEQLRTYALDATGKFVPLRRLSRGGGCVRWITGPSMNELGGHVPWAILAVVSRDGRSVIASGRAGENTSISVATDAMFTCLHTDSTVQVSAAGRVTTQQFFWFLEGSLEELLRRASRDLKLQIPAASSG